MLGAALAFFMQAKIFRFEKSDEDYVNLSEERKTEEWQNIRNGLNFAKKVLYTGHIGYGKIYVYDVENVVMVRTGEEGYDALQDVE